MERALVVLHGSALRTYLLPARGEVVIGRGEGCEVQIGDTKLSRKHAVLRIGDGVEITDLGSRNGTFIGTKRLRAESPARFDEGDVVSLGSAALVLKPWEERDTDAASPLAPDLPHERIVRGGVMRKLEPMIQKLASGDISVLVLGETGAGKEVLAHALHDASARQKRPFVSINCAAISETLLESELFGYERGAFTGATHAKEGLLEAASGGSVLLDEIGEMPLALQAKLLRVLESGEVLRVGSLKPRSIDVRFISATNKDLETEVDAGRFRRDLYFRLAGAVIELPPLRERTDEIEPLARAFAASACSKLGKPALGIDPTAVDFLTHYTGPGNIRELRNVVERAVLLCGGKHITLANLPCERMARRHVPIDLRETEGVESPAPVIAEGGATDERARLVTALEQCAGNQTRAAKLLGIGRRTLIVRMAKYGLPRPRK